LQAASVVAVVHVSADVSADASAPGGISVPVWQYAMPAEQI
jgi:hypothetical protein